MKRTSVLLPVLALASSAPALDYKFSGTIWSSTDQSAVPIGQSFSGSVHLTGVAIDGSNDFSSFYHSVGSMSIQAGGLSVEHGMRQITITNDMPQYASILDPPYGYEDGIRLDADNLQHPPDESSLALTFSRLTMDQPGGPLTSTSWDGWLPLGGWQTPEINVYDGRSKNTVIGDLTDIEPVPEPSTLLALGFGVVFFGRSRRYGQNAARAKPSPER